MSTDGIAAKKKPTENSSLFDGKKVVLRKVKIKTGMCPKKRF
jgi:hypothetical protein